MIRVAGSDRWATAYLVGRYAATRSAATLRDERSSSGAVVTVPADVRTAGVFLGGAGLWVSSDCAGEVPVVVASDAAAQSDIYSAVTLAGAVGTECVILAGPRDAPVPPSQRARLRETAPGGYVIGGTAAVPSSKVAGRDMTRIAGRDRWDTAHLVGRLAGGDVSVGRSTAVGLAAVVVGGAHSCGLRQGGSVVCWGSNQFGQLDVPSGVFAAVVAGSAHSCGLLSGGSVVCWGSNQFGQLDVPSGVFAGVVAGGAHSCGLRQGGSVVCWGSNQFGQLDVPSGVFAGVVTGGAHSCGLRSGGSVVCWGNDEFGQSSPPSGVFAGVVTGGAHSCGLRSGGSVVCWGSNQFGQLDVPSGVFAGVVTGGAHSCGLLSGGSVVCWGNDEFGQSSPPLG